MLTTPFLAMVPVMLTFTFGWKPGASSLSSFAAVCPAPVPAAHWASAVSMRVSASLSMPSLHCGSGWGVRSRFSEPICTCPPVDCSANVPGLRTFCAPTVAGSTAAAIATAHAAANATRLFLVIPVPPNDIDRHGQMDHWSFPRDRCEVKQPFPPPPGLPRPFCVAGTRS